MQGQVRSAKAGDAGCALLDGSGAFSDCHVWVTALCGQRTPGWSPHLGDEDVSRDVVGKGDTAGLGLSVLCGDDARSLTPHRR